MTEMLGSVMMGAYMELHPWELRKRLRAMRYGRGSHAAMRTPVQEAAHVAGVVASLAALGVGVFAAVAFGL